MWVRDFIEWSRGHRHEADPEVYDWSVGNQYSDEWEEQDVLGRICREHANQDIYRGTFELEFLPFFTLQSDWESED